MLPLFLNFKERVTILHIILHKDASDVKNSCMLFNAMTKRNGKSIACIDIFMACSDSTLEFPDTAIVKSIISSRT